MATDQCTHNSPIKKDLTGQAFGSWTVLGFAFRRKHKTYFVCECKCGNVKPVFSQSLQRGLSKSCGCEMPPKRMRKIANSINTEHDCPPLPRISGVRLRHCIGYPGYAIGDDGSAWSCRPCVRSGLTIQWRRLVAYPDKQGYLHISCQVGGKLARPKVGHLVANAFIDPRPGRLDLCHGDGNNQNNRVENLRWGTRSDNMRDALRHGTFHVVGHPGERNANSKITTAQVEEIRNTPGKSHVEWARELGVTPTAIYSIRAGRTWKNEAVYRHNN